jgi:acetylornithine deacetylase/succinyl-diaminopimelate desuccinylase-like protein
MSWRCVRSSRPRRHSPPGVQWSTGTLARWLRPLRIRHALSAQVAEGLRAVLVLEPSADSALKTGRKDISMYQVRVTGRAAHAGLEPDQDVNALLELADQVRDIARLGFGPLTVTPTLAHAVTSDRHNQGKVREQPDRSRSWPVEVPATADARLETTPPRAGRYSPALEQAPRQVVV